MLTTSFVVWFFKRTCSQYYVAPKKLQLKTKRFVSGDFMRFCQNVIFNSSTWVEENQKFGPMGFELETLTSITNYIYESWTMYMSHDLDYYTWLIICVSIPVTNYVEVQSMCMQMNALWNPRWLQGNPCASPLCHHFDPRGTSPPRGVSLVCGSLVKNLEEEDPPWRTAPKLINFGGVSSGGVLFLRVLDLETIQQRKRGVSFDQLMYVTKHVDRDSCAVQQALTPETRLDCHLCIHTYVCLRTTYISHQPSILETMLLHREEWDTTCLINCVSRTTHALRTTCLIHQLSTWESPTMLLHREEWDATCLITYGTRNTYLSNQLCGWVQKGRLRQSVTFAFM